MVSFWLSINKRTRGTSEQTQAESNFTNSNDGGIDVFIKNKKKFRASIGMEELPYYQVENRIR